MAVVSMKSVTPAQTEAPVPGAVSADAASAMPDAVGALRLKGMVVSAVRLLVPPALGLLLFVFAWAQVSALSSLPGPVKTWESAVQLFSHPFYVNGPND